jgi:hypothetical protein
MDVCFCRIHAISSTAYSSQLYGWQWMIRCTSLLGSGVWLAIGPFTSPLLCHHVVCRCLTHRQPRWGDSPNSGVDQEAISRHADDVMSDGLNIFENETQALGMHSDTHSQWSENPGSRDRNPLRAQDHHKAKMGDPVWSFEENDLRHVLKAKHCLFHPSGSVPQGISALDTHSEFLDTLKALGHRGLELWH